jgi:hypothetical protein
LRIRVNQQNPPTCIDQISRKSEDGSGFAHAATLIRNEKANHRDRLSKIALRTISTSFVDHLRYAVNG